MFCKGQLLAILMLISAYWGQLGKTQTRTARKSKITSITITSLELHFPATSLAWKIFYQLLIPIWVFYKPRLKKKKSLNLSNAGPKICLFCNLVRVRDHQCVFLLLVSSLPAPYVCSSCIRRVSGIHFLWWPAKAQISKLQEAVRDAVVWPSLHFAHRIASCTEYSICRGQRTVL